MTNLTEEYLAYCEKYTKEYGNNTCVLMQIGSFYEMQMVKDGNIFDVSRLLNIQVTKKNKSIAEVSKRNPYMAGFPKHSLPKFLPVLIENNFTVVVIEQDEVNKKSRNVTGVYSPSIQPLEFDCNGNGEGNIGSFVSVYIDICEHSVCFSVCNVNNFTNTFDVYENGTCDKKITIDNVLDDMMKILVRYSCNEYIFNVKSWSYVNKKQTVSKLLDFKKSYVIDYLNLHGKLVHWKELSNENSSERGLDYQNHFLKTVYTHVNFGLLSPIEYFDMEKFSSAIINTIYALEFLKKHNEKYLINIAPPKMVHDYDFVTLEMNTLQQLSVISSGRDGQLSLFDILNKTKTSIGKRGLKTLLCKPYKSESEIIRRYQFSDALNTINNNNFLKIIKYLSDISDFERLYRRLSLGVLHPYEFVNFYDSLLTVSELNKFLQDFEQITSECLDRHVYEQIMLFFHKSNETFDLIEMKKYNLNDQLNNFFQKGKQPCIDDIQFKLDNLEQEVDALRTQLESKVDKMVLKTTYTDTDGYFFTCTKIRGQCLKAKIDSSEYDFKYMSNTCKITSSGLSTISKKMINLRDLLNKKIRILYIQQLELFSKDLEKSIVHAKYFVELLDICQSNVKCKKDYGYCRPEINSDDNSESFLIAKAIRHPIIERINQETTYIPNDIILGSEQRGIILYALNSCGKSSLLRSVGLCTIMAQCGLYVPCSQFSYKPFSCIVSQVDLQDNFWKGHSSYITEMRGLRKILQVSDENTLVLSDELTKGTEVHSATSIFAAAVLELLKRKSKFIFTTHLQDVAKLDEINNKKDLCISHLSVNVVNDNIIFERKLKPGPCSELYGLEVARAVGLDKELIEMSFAIRDKLLNRKSTLASDKRSRYNKKKILEKCEICNYCPVKATDIPLDTHHIKFQCSADINNFTEHFHKNTKSNLVCLCKQCHVSVHQGAIIIHGYRQSTSGIFLEYERSKLIPS
jgi:DNA mismatch repair protein MutS